MWWVIWPVVWLKPTLVSNVAAPATRGGRSCEVSVLRSSSHAFHLAWARPLHNDYVYMDAFGIFLAASPSMTSDQPLKIMSMPMKSPMTQRPDRGHCRQIAIPSNRLIRP